jgi:ABC-2 type transport system permease protein
MILTLVKINLIALFSGMFKRYRGKKKVKATPAILIGLLVIFVIGSLLFTVGAMFYGMCAPLFEAGIGWFYFALAGILVFALCFIGGVFMVQAQIFSARDNELLLSMPIKPSAILGGRLAALLVVEYLYEAIILIPVFIVLIISGQISQIPALGIIFFFASAVLLPLIALALGCLVGWLVALAASRMRNKNIPTLILSIAFLAAYLWFYSDMVNNMNMLIMRGEEIAEAVRRAVFPAYHLGISIARGSIQSFLIFAVCAMVPFAVMCLLLSRSFVKLTTGGRVARKIEYREKTLRVSGARLALLKRELLHLWSLPMYIMNAALGAIATIILAGVLVVSPAVLIEPLAEVTAIFPSLDIGLMGAVMLSALTVMNFVSAPSISLEGKRLWIVKSLPVPARDVLLSKAYLHLVVCGIPTVLAAIVCIAVLPMSGLLQIALTLILPASVTLMFSMLGVTLNLAFLRFDWINPLQPVKQGISVMLTMFGGMALIAVLVLVYTLLYAVGAPLPLEIYLLLCTVVFLAASAGLYTYLIGKGSRKFETL